MPVDETFETSEYYTKGVNWCIQDNTHLIQKCNTKKNELQVVMRDNCCQKIYLKIRKR